MHSAISWRSLNTRMCHANIYSMSFSYNIDFLEGGTYITLWFSDKLYFIGDFQRRITQKILYIMGRNKHFYGRVDLWAHYVKRGSFYCACGRRLARVQMDYFLHQKGFQAMLNFPDGDVLW